MSNHFWVVDKQLFETIFFRDVNKKSFFIFYQKVFKIFSPHRLMFMCVTNEMVRLGYVLSRTG